MITMGRYEVWSVNRITGEDYLVRVTFKSLEHGVDAIHQMPIDQAPAIGTTVVMGWE